MAIDRSEFTSYENREQQITFRPDLLTAVVASGVLDGAVLELCWAAGSQNHPSTAPAPTAFPLPNGLAHGSRLMLRSEDQWLDWHRPPHTDVPAMPQSSGSSPALSWIFSWRTERDNTWSRTRGPRGRIAEEDAQDHRRLRIAGRRNPDRVSPSSNSRTGS